MTPEERLDRIELIFIEMSAKLDLTIAENDQILSVLTRQRDQINLLKKAISNGRQGASGVRQDDLGRSRMFVIPNRLDLDLSRMPLN